MECGDSSLLPETQLAENRSHQNHQQQQRRRTSLSLQQAVAEGGEREMPTFSQFALAELKAATNGFNPQNVVSESGDKALQCRVHGPAAEPPVNRRQEVHQDRLARSQSVRRTRHMFCWDLHEEAWGVGKLRHRRLANLIGYCCDGEERLLVAEYMPNDTLAKHLFHYTGKSNY